MQHITLLLMSVLAAIFLVKYIKAIIRLIVIVLLGLAAYGLFTLLAEFSAH